MFKPLPQNPELILPNTPEEAELEDDVFAWRNASNLPEEPKELFQKLWKQFVLREVYMPGFNPAKPMAETTACPFCGTKDHHILHSGRISNLVEIQDIFAKVQCTHCSATGPTVFEDKELHAQHKAIFFWVNASSVRTK